MRQPTQQVPKKSPAQGGFRQIWLQRIFGNRIGGFFGVCALVFILLAGIRQLGWLQELELGAYDLSHLVELGAVQRGSAPPITLVWITDADEKRYGLPLPDRYLADVLIHIQQHGPRVLGIDLYRDLPVLDKECGGGLTQLETVLRESANTVAIYLFDKIAPPPVLSGSERIGFSDLLYDEGGLIRRGLLAQDDGRDWHFAFSLVLAMHYLAPQGIQLGVDPEQPDLWRLGRVTIPPLDPDFGAYVREDARGYQYLLDFRGPPVAVKELSVDDVLSDRYKAEDFRERLVIIGNRSDVSKDHFFTPRSRWQGGDQRVFGALIHAVAAARLIQAATGGYRPIRSVADGHEYLYLLLWIMAGGLVAFGARSLSRYLLFSLIGLSLVMVSALLALRLGWWIPLLPPALGFLICGALHASLLSAREHRERRELMQLFARRVSPPVAELYWRQRHKLLCHGSLSPQELTATVLFTDLKDFTRVAEGRQPVELMEWLNAYMELMVEAVFLHQGHVDKIIGDAVMAVFGVPFPRTTDVEIGADARRAVDCALEMSRRLEHFNKQWGREGFAPVGMRIGLYTGELVAGTLGSAQRQEYTVLGDTVNTAARLESFDKTLGAMDCCRILLGETTRNHLPDDYATESVGEVELKGKAKKIRVHRLLKV